MELWLDNHDVSKPTWIVDRLDSTEEKMVWCVIIQLVEMSTLGRFVEYLVLLFGRPGEMLSGNWSKRSLTDRCDAGIKRERMAGGMWQAWFRACWTSFGMLSVQAMPRPIQSPSINIGGIMLSSSSGSNAEPSDKSDAEPGPPPKRRGKKYTDKMWAASQCCVGWSGCICTRGTSGMESK